MSAPRRWSCSRDLSRRIGPGHDGIGANAPVIAGCGRDATVVVVWHIRGASGLPLRRAFAVCEFHARELHGLKHVERVYPLL